MDGSYTENELQIKTEDIELIHEEISSKNDNKKNVKYTIVGGILLIILVIITTIIKKTRNKN